MDDMKRLLPALPLLLALLAGPGCVINYLPPPALMPMAEEAGDVHLMASAGLSGFHAAGHYAVTDQLGAFVGAQGTTGATDRYEHLFAGVRYLGAGRNPPAEVGTTPPPSISPLRWSLGLTGGGGYTRDVTSGTVGQSGYSIDYEGVFLRTAFEADVAFESEFLSFGLQGRLAYFRMWHSDRSEHPGGVGSMWLAEPTLVLRPGIPEFKFDLQLGVSLPFAVQTPVGLPLPITFSLGFIVDL